MQSSLMTYFSGVSYNDFISFGGVRYFVGTCSLYFISFGETSYINSTSFDGAGYFDFISFEDDDCVVMISYRLVV